MKSLNLPDEAAPAIRSFTVEGKPFELSVRQQARGDWHWLMTAPGQIVLSGAAPSEMQALDSACRTGKALARFIAA